MITLWGWEKKPRTMLRYIKIGDIFCFRYSHRTYRFGRIMAKVIFHIVEIFDCASDQPVITEADILAAKRLLVTPLDTYRLFDRKSEGEWRIVGHQEDYTPPEDARDIWFSWGDSDCGKKSNVFDQTEPISKAEWRALPPLSPGGDYDVKRDVAKRLIGAVDWYRYETAYGNAAQDIPHFQCGQTPSVPHSLEKLFSGNWNKAMQAASDLWAGLCHQHAYVSSAALPAYDFLILALQEADDKLKVELLDIFLGFAVCTGRFSSDALWPRQLRDKLTADLPIFAALAASEHEEVSDFAQDIVTELTKKEA